MSAGVWDVNEGRACPLDEPGAMKSEIKRRAIISTPLRLKLMNVRKSLAMMCQQGA